MMCLCLLRVVTILTQEGLAISAMMRSHQRCGHCSYPGNEAGGLVEEARNVLLWVIVDMHCQVGEMFLVEARHDGRRVQNMGDPALLQGFQVSSRSYRTCIEPPCLSSFHSYLSNQNFYVLSCSQNTSDIVMTVCYVTQAVL